MHILIGCEFSGTVRRAFKKKGAAGSNSFSSRWSQYSREHDVYSCDLLPCDDFSPYHFQEDVFKTISRLKWDIIIIHPPCTHLAVSGNRWYGKNKPKHYKRQESIVWTMKLWETAKECSKMVCMENPVGVLPIKPTQYVQPWQFGHAESKKTGLWLHNLPKLAPTNIIEKPECGYWENQTPSGQNNLGPSEDRWKKRSLTYEGIAQAMAEQWGEIK